MENNKKLVFKILNEIKYNKRYMLNWIEWANGLNDVNENSIYDAIDFLLSDVRSRIDLLEEVHCNFKSVPVFKKTLKKDSNYFKKTENIISFDSSEKLNKELIEYNYFFQGDATSLALSALWIEKVGSILDSSLKNNVYANRINEKSSFFKPYFNEYSAFRNNNFNRMKNLVKQNKTGVYVQLDLEACFYNVNINLLNNRVKSIISDYCKENDISKREKKIINHLNQQIFNIINRYNKEIEELKTETRKGGFLPIGFLPSNILINIYLQTFDKILQQKFNPVEYGRYVDDTCFLISREITSDDKYEQVSQIKKELESAKKMADDEEMFLKLNSEKTIFFIISEKNDINYLKKFEKSIVNLSSDQHRLMDINQFEEEFSKAYLLQEDVTKMTDMFTITKDKKYLSRMISTIFYSFFGSLKKIDNKDNIVLAKKFIQYFYSFVDDELFTELYDYWYQLVGIELVANKTIENELQFSFKSEYIKQTRTVEKMNSLLSKNVKKELNKKNHSFHWNFSEKLINEFDKFLYVFIELIYKCYCDNFSELSLLKQLQLYFRVPKFKNKVLKEKNLLLNHELQLNNLWEWRKSLEYRNLLEIIDDLNSFGDTVCESDLYTLYNTKLNLSFGQANMYEYDQRSSYFLQYSKNISSFSDVIQILNEGSKNKIDVIEFPEQGLTFEDLDLVVRQSARTQTLIIGGLDFILSQNKVFNLTISIIPIIKKIKNQEYKDAYILLSPKKYPAPEEYESIHHSRSQIEQIHREMFLPVQEDDFEFKSIVFDYRGVKHAIINCYEATDVFLKYHIAKKKPHFIHLITNNKDIDYYQHIAENLARELMCVVSITNYSKLGGTFLYIPFKESYKRIVSYHKGSLNTHLDISNIKFDEIISKRFYNRDERFKQNPPMFYYSNIFGEED